jgi:hypothetical protein
VSGKHTTRLGAPEGGVVQQCQPGVKAKHSSATAHSSTTWRGAVLERSYHPCLPVAHRQLASSNCYAVINTQTVCSASSPGYCPSLQ